MTKDEALKLALEWFEGVDEDPAYGVQGHQVIAAIKEALAQPEQEQNKNGSPCPEFWDWLPKAYNFEGDGNFTKYNMEVAFLAGKQSQPQQEPWEKFCDSNCVWTDHHPDCKLAEQEPVAWKIVPIKPTNEMLKAMDECSTEGYDERLYAGHAASVYMAAVDVAPTPPQLKEPHKRPSRSDIKPLSDDEIILIVAECASSHQHTDIHFARAIEQAHGIKGLV